MNKIFKSFLLLLVYIFLSFFTTFAQNSISDINKKGNSLPEVTATKYFILPLGNSITFDNRENDNRNIGEKAGYRYPLYQLLKNAGYNFDFIGSEHSGGSYLPAGFDDNAGFPGITDNQLFDLMQTGRLLQLPQGIDRQITVGPYLNTYSPDIILLHIGTNNNELPGGTSPLEVEQILDQVDEYEFQNGKEVIVFLARIIDRVPNEAFVTQFNNNIETMALDRVNNPLNDAYPDNVFIVDMEDSADINYTISPDPNGSPGDMNDSAHPNNNGYAKMAYQWFKAIEQVLPNPPKILIQPVNQFTIEGGTASFSVSGESEENISYQWKKNGSNIPLANNSQLLISNAKLSDNNSNYQCVMSNINGSVTSEIVKLFVNRIDERIQQGILAEYDFEEGEGDIIQNKVGVNTELDLKIFSPSSINWIQNGISLFNAADIATSTSATVINDSIIISNSFAFELWFSTSQLSQFGPARIITLSENIDERNFTIGQNSNDLVFRTRSTLTNPNGIPEFVIEEGILSNELFHLVVSRDKFGLQKIYLNGELKDSVNSGGDLSNWNSSYKLAIGNEFQSNQPWLGSIFYLAIYQRNLTVEEIQHNFNLGEDGLTSFNYVPQDFKSNFELHQNYPNPFNPSTKINFDLPEASKVSLTICNMLGQQVMNVLNKDFSAGRYNYDFDGSNLTSGIYIYSLTASGANGNNFTKSRKMILVK